MKRILSRNLVECWAIARNPHPFHPHATSLLVRRAELWVVVKAQQRRRMLEELPLGLQRYYNTLPTSNACSSNQTPAKPFYSHLYVLTLDHRSVQPSPQKAQASSHRNSRHRRSRRETSFWPPAPSKSAVHVTPTRPLKRGATINGSGVYHGSLLQSYPES